MITWLEHCGQRMIESFARDLHYCPGCGGVVTGRDRYAKWGGLLRGRQ